MKFGQVAWLILTVLMQGFLRTSAQDCPTDNLFLSGRKTGTINPARMETLAGLAASRVNAGVLWGHDFGAINRIFAIATGSKAIADFTFNRTLTDAEDIAVGPGPASSGEYIYIADSGGVRNSIVIARFKAPVIDATTTGVIPLPDQTYFTLQYPDGSHDARGLMIDPVSNDLFVVTYDALNARMYSATQATLTANGTMTFVGTAAIAEVTAADISADGAQIAMRSVSNALRWIRRPGQTIAQALATTPQQAMVLEAFETNGQSLAFAADGSGYYTTGQGADPLLLFFERNRTRFTIGAGIATIEDPALSELSGIAASRLNPGLLWVHNDGPQIYVHLVSTNGTSFGTYIFAGQMGDFEDIAIGPGPQLNTNYVYCGDIGDNLVNRTEIHVFRFPEPRVTEPPNDVVATGETIITLKYPDGAHDAEALLVDPISGDLFVVTKEIGVFRAYKATQAQLNSGNVVQLTLAQNGNFGPVSGGDISPDGTQIILRHENQAQLWRRKTGESVETALGRASEQAPVISEPAEPNGEGITFAPDSRGYYTISEGSSPIIYFFEPLAQPRFTKPPEIIGNIVRLTISGCEGSRIRLEASSNLITWNSAGSADVVNRVAIIEAGAGEQRFFFRALVDPL